LVTAAVGIGPHHLRASALLDVQLAVRFFNKLLVSWSYGKTRSGVYSPGPAIHFWR
jgi:hypothetical protein